MHVEPLDLTCVEAFAASAPFPLTSLERVVYPPHAERGALLKAHVLDYYLRVAEWMLPHVTGRPLVFRRYPDGITSKPFYTKDWTDQTLPEAVRRVRVHSVSRDEPMEYAVADTPQALAWCAQTSAIEVHPWLARLGHDPGACAGAGGLRSSACGLDRPDVLALDVDPYVRAGRTGAKGTEAGGEPGLDPEDWRDAVDVALAVRDVLDDLGMPSFVKTSGKRGIHVLVPLEPAHDFDTVRAFAQTFGAHVTRKMPDKVTMSYAFGDRKGRVFLDCNQNVRGKTLAAPYSLRPTPEASVSMPVAWDALRKIDPADFTLLNVPTILREHGDAWAGFEDARVDLAEALREQV